MLLNKTDPEICKDFLEMTSIDTHCSQDNAHNANLHHQTRQKDSSRLDWFDQARLGLFLHWGLYSILSDSDRNEWVLHGKNLDHAEYNLLARQFYAQRYDPKCWAAIARRAGMKYVVLTTRHHDGFCLFDTKTTPYNTMYAAVGRDLIAEYIEALREAGLRVGLYYSIKSWQWPAIINGPGADPEGWDAMVNQTHEQLRELMTHYGKIDLLWYDGCVVPGVQDNGIRARYWRSRELNRMIRSLQPHIIINDRSGLPEDYSTPEQRVNPPARGRRWEACMTLNRSWAYNIHDRDFKSPAILKQALIRCARYGGNLLLGIGPRADGSIQDEFVMRLESVGDWMQINGQAIFNSQRTDYTEAEHVAGAVTQRGNDYFVHLKSYPGSVIRLDGLGHALSVKLLGQDGVLQTKTVLNGALEVSGFTRDMPWTEGPLVLQVTTDKPAQSAANWLGGGDVLRITAGNAPVLGFDPDHYTPPVMPVICGEALAAELDQDQYPVKVMPSSRWCPGWKDWDIFLPTRENTLSLTMNVPVKNAYTFDMGLIASKTGTVRIQINGQTLDQTFTINHPGNPDTWTLDELVLEQGKQQITLTADVPFGFYAMRCSTCWRELPANKWWTIGPFETDFKPQRPVSDVRKAMEKIYAPQIEFDLQKTYQGTRDLKIQWKHYQTCEGQHSETGVNFPYHCGDKFSGTCFARTIINSPEDRDTQILIGCDWWANAWINDTLITTGRDPELIEEDGAQFNCWKPMLASIRLKKGRNVLLVKSHPGSTANWFTCRIADPGDLNIGIEK